MGHKINEIMSNADLEGLVDAFVRTSTAAFIVTDVDGIVLWCNARVVDLYNGPVSEIIGADIRDIMLHHAFQEVVRSNQRLQQARERGYTEIARSRLVTGPNNDRFIHHWVYRLDDRDGNHIGFVGVIYEVTDENRSIEESRAAIKVLSEMREGEIREKQLQVIEMVKARGAALCPVKLQDDADCPAVTAVEASVKENDYSLAGLLTTTELIVAKYVRQSMSIKAISEKMCISERTVKNHRYAIRKKLNLSHSNVPLGKYLNGFKI